MVADAECSESWLCVIMGEGINCSFPSLGGGTLQMRVDLLDAVMVLTPLVCFPPQGRICRKPGKSKKAFNRKEAEATFKSLVKTHEKYGWVSPPVSDG